MHDRTNFSSERTPHAGLGTPSIKVLRDSHEAPACRHQSQPASALGVSGRIIALISCTQSEFHFHSTSTYLPPLSRCKGLGKRFHFHL
jgi:hypothetical protein